MKKTPTTLLTSVGLSVLMAFSACKRQPEPSVAESKTSPTPQAKNVWRFDFGAPPDKASIPADRQLKSDLTGPKTKPDSAGTIFLESKKDMKARGLASPDAADAIAVTFAYPVASREPRVAQARRTYSDRSSGATSWMCS